MLAVRSRALPQSRGSAATGGRLPFLSNRAGAWLCVLVAAVVFAVAAVAAPTFPALSGRVVDAANVIPQASRGALEQRLHDLEDKSGIQLVVATVPSLEGYDVETYANQLFRTWKLGEKKNNNGVLFLVAPQDRKVRIEAGYGLEGTLTDALSKLIIVNAVAPRFKAGDYGGGIERGVDEIVSTLSVDSGEWAGSRPKLRADEPQSSDAVLPFILFGIIIFVFFVIRRNSYAPGQGRFGGGPVFIPMGGSSWGGSSWGGSSWGGSSWGGSGGGFSGGGGSSGGGGASGSW